VLPPVVAVVVAHDPGPWFETTLASLRDQTYANVSVLVVDTASQVPVAERVAAVLPDAPVRRLGADPGFGAACNEVMRAVEGAAFYLFCHDDVRLAPDVVQILVEEAFRSNAGVVGPKLVDWHAPDRLLAVGMGADKTGYPVAHVDRGELDQSQHDTVRDVFYIPGAATLVRADLFATLGGFDPGIDFHGEDLDLCWRARVAGARVVVAPDAVVGHLEALGLRRPVDDRRRLQMRHRLRVMKVASSWWTRVRVTPQALLVALVEAVYALVLGRFRQVRDVTGAWWWNLRHHGELRRRRRALRAVRRVPDREVRQAQVRGLARPAAFLRGQLGAGEDRLGALAGARQGFRTLRSSRATSALVAWGLVAAVLLVGSRALLLQPIPAVGDFPVLGDGPGALLSEFLSGYRDVGLGAVAPNPTGLGVVGLAGLVTFGSMELLRKVLVLGLLPVGAVGMWRLAKPIGSRRSRITALVVFLAVPVPYNAIAQGDWSALTVWAATPWVLGQLARASGVAPFGWWGGEAGPGVRRRPLVQRIVAVGVIGGLAAMLVPGAAALAAVLAVALVLGGALAGQLAGAARVLAVGAGGMVVTFVLQLPWSAGFIGAGWEPLLDAGRTGAAPDLGAVLRFQTGPIGAGPLGYVFLLTGGLALLIGRDWRVAWPVRCWAVVLTAMAAAWIAGQDWIEASLPGATVLLAPAAGALALASAMGMAAFEVDLPDYHFGWRQILSVVAGAALVLGVLPVLAAALDGRWGLPRGDLNRALAFLEAEGERAPFRVLWVGDPAVLPLASWPLDSPPGDPPLGYGTSSDGLPDLGDRWGSGAQGPTEERLGRVLQATADGGTSRLGSLLAPMGVRYVVVPLGPAPAPWAGERAPRPDRLLAALDAQLDLSTVDLPAGVVVYRNNAWGPSRAQLPPGTPVPAGGERLVDGRFPAVEGAPVALPDSDGYERSSGELPAGVVYLAEASSPQWRLSVDGVEVPRQDALGWSNAFVVDRPGRAELWFATPSSRRWWLAGQGALWLVAVVYLLRVRVVTDEARDLARPAERPRRRTTAGDDERVAERVWSGV
jgi:GT2 family glycosyltransferase